MIRLSRDLCSLCFFPIAALCIVTQLYLLLPVTLLLSRIMGVNEQQIGLLTSAFILFYAVGMLIWGPISDRFGRKRIMLITMAVLTSLTFAIALNDHFLSVLIMRAFQGFFAAAFPPVALAWMSENLQIRNKLRGIALMSSAFLLSGIIGQWFGEATIIDGLFWPMLILGICYGLSFLAISLLKDRHTISQHTGVLTIISSVLPTLFSHALRKAYAASFFILASLVSFYIYLTQEPAFATSLATINLDPAGLRLMAIPCMLMPLLVTRFITKYGPERTIAYALIAAGISLFGQYLFALIPIWFVVVFHLIFVAAISTAIPGVIGLISQRSLPEVRGLAVSLYTFILFFGVSLGNSLSLQYGGEIMVPVLSFTLTGLGLWIYGMTAKKSISVSLLALFSLVMYSVSPVKANGLSKVEVMMMNVDSYKQRLALSELDYQILFTIDGLMDKQPITLSRYQPQTSDSIRYGYAQVSFVLDTEGRLKGFARMNPQLAVGQQVSKENAETIARDFLAEYAADLLPVMDVQWVAPHDEVVLDTDGKKITLTGMKVKSRNRDNGLYFWVIVAPDSSVMVFERDINWDFIRAGRQTEKWLHDSWLKKQKW
ncbi:Inner membrane transport protein ynfM [Pragia fontium]|nr:Inner membrane transport protein ynfM [Pragia fontium]